MFVGFFEGGSHYVALVGLEPILTFFYLLSVEIKGISGHIQPLFPILKTILQWHSFLGRPEQISLHPTRYHDRPKKQRPSLQPEEPMSALT